MGKRFFLMSLVGLLAATFQPATASAHHHGHFGHFGHYYGGGWNHCYYPSYGYRSWGSYGMSSYGFGYSSYYSSFPSYVSYRSCWPIRTRYYYSYPVVYSSYYSTPVYYSAPVYSTYCAPVCSTNYYSTPSYSQPIYSTPSTAPIYSAPVQYSASTSSPQITTVARTIPLTTPVVRPPATLPRPSTLPGSSVQAPTGQFASIDSPSQNTPIVKAPYKSEWIETAVNLIDLMIEQGDASAAYAACGRLEELKPGQLPASVYLRSAILASATQQSAPTIAKHIRKAQELGSKLSPSELPAGSLRNYLKGDSSIDLDAVLDRLARAAMQRDDSSEHLFVLATLLNLDGQSERAQVFAKAAKQQLPSPLQSVAADLSR